MDGASASTSGCGPRGCSRRARWPPRRSRAAGCTSTARPSSPATTCGPGDTLELSTTQPRRELVVRATSERRGPASEAALLYEETAESRAAREAFAAQRRLERPPVHEPGARPTKRDRRRYERATGARRRGGR